MFSGPKLYQCSHCKTTKLGAVTSVGTVGNGVRDILPEGWGYCYMLVGNAVQMFIVCSELCSEEYEEKTLITEDQIMKALHEGKKEATSL